MADYSTLLFDVRNNVAYVTLNRPEAANALNAELAHDLMEVSLRCEEDPSVRAVLINAAGKLFCAGGDLKSFAAQPKEMLPTYFKKVTFSLHKAISRFNRMKAPVVMAIQGAAGGAGMSLACAGDIVIAAESAKFTMAYTRAGLTPDGSSTYFLPRIVGLRRAMDLALTNRVLSAREAHEMGIVTRVVPDAELMATAEGLAQGLRPGADARLPGRQAPVRRERDPDARRSDGAGDRVDRRHGPHRRRLRGDRGVSGKAPAEIQRRVTPYRSIKNKPASVRMMPNEARGTLT